MLVGFLSWLLTGLSCLYCLSQTSDERELKFPFRELMIKCDSFAS